MGAAAFNNCRLVRLPRTQSPVWVGWCPISLSARFVDRFMLWFSIARQAIKLIFVKGIEYYTKGTK